MHSQLEALLVLLFDTDGFVSESAYQALVGMGLRVLPNLQQYADHATNISTFEQELVEDVIFDIHLNKISHQLGHWAAFRSHDLWEGLCLVNNIICPELSFHNAKKMLDIIYQTMHNKITRPQQSTTLFCERCYIRAFRLRFVDYCSILSVGTSFATWFVAVRIRQQYRYAGLRKYAPI